MALALGERGVNVIATYISSEKEANDVVAAIRVQGRNAVALRLDFTKTPSTIGLRCEAAARTGVVARAHRRPREQRRLGWRRAVHGDHGSDLRHARRGSLQRAFFLTQKQLPRLADGGRIVNVSAGVTRYRFPGVSAHAAVKSALEAVTRALAVERAASHHRQRRRPWRHPHRLRRRIPARSPSSRRRSSPTRRSAASAEDVASVIASLLSPDTRWVTDQRIEVTGGYRL